MTSSCSSFEKMKGSERKRGKTHVNRVGSFSSLLRDSEGSASASVPVPVSVLVPVFWLGLNPQLRRVKAVGAV